MNKLPAEAYAIIEGKHSDPFRYLGLHSEGDHSVVRAFIPEASNVEAVGEHGETAPLERIHDAGLFAGALPNGSKRYQLRARFGDNVVDLDDPYRFPPVLGDMDLYLLGEGTHLRDYDKLGAHPMTLDGVDGVAFAVWAPNAQARQRGRRFQFLGRAPPPDAGARRRLLGDCSCPAPRPASSTNSRSGPDGRRSAVKADPYGVRHGDAARDGLDRRRRANDCRHPRPAPEGANGMRRADLDL